MFSFLRCTDLAAMTATILDGLDLPTLVRRASETFGDRVGLVIDATGERLSFAQIHDRADALAGRLSRLGVLRGDRVAVMLANGAEFPLLWLAIARLGAVIVPINLAAQVEDLTHLISTASAKVAIVESGSLELMTRVQARCVDLAEVLTIDQLHRLLAAELPQLSCDPHRALNLQFTSGTSGKPKACVLSHGYWLGIAEQAITSEWSLSSEDVLLTAQPFFYMDPQWNFVVALALGAPLVVLDRFSPSSFMEKVRAHDVTFFYCLGVMPTLLLKTPIDPRDTDNRLRLVLCSGIPAGEHAALERRFGAPWYEIYGMTETGGATIAMTPTDHERLVGTGALGRATPRVALRLCDEAGQDVGVDEVGEILLQGEGFMDCYWQDPEATAEVWRGGWFHTGDLASRSASGIVTFHGRSKDVIKRSGENISAAEVEEVLMGSDLVRLAAVLAVPDEIRGEEAKAFVVLAHVDGSDLAVLAERLTRHCRDALAAFKVPRYWEFVDELPRTPSEKVAKAELSRAATGIDVLALRPSTPAGSTT